MKKVIYIRTKQVTTSIKLALILCVFVSMTASAHDLIQPDWRGLDKTTYQQWRFDTNSNPAEPEVIDNNYGDAGASVTVGFMGVGWLSELGFGSQTGHWDLGGDGGQIVLQLANCPLVSGRKEIWVQVTYFRDISMPPSVNVPGAGLQSTQTLLVEDAGISGGWFLDQTIWWIDPNPSQEQIILSSDPEWGSVIEQVVVDTIVRALPCIVDFNDLAMFCKQWLQTGLNLDADLDNSGRVDFRDFSILANSWLDVCPPDWPFE